MRIYEKIIWAAIALGGGCGGKAECVDGSSVACACPTGGTGAQVCSSGAYGACSCVAPGPAVNAAPIAQPTPAPRLDPAQRAADAERWAKETQRAAADAADRVQRLAGDLDDLSARTDKATDAVMSAQNDAERMAAKTKLDQLRKEKATMEANLAAAKQAAAAVQRRAGVHIKQECLDNPLAAGCQ